LAQVGAIKKYRCRSPIPGTHSGQMRCLPRQRQSHSGNPKALEAFMGEAGQARSEYLPIHERALQMARSGRMKTVDDIRSALYKEHYSLNALQDAGLIRRLRALIRSAGEPSASEANAPTIALISNGLTPFG
jgi:hypothetical protein